jgi:hypothetical protein
MYKGKVYVLRSQLMKNLMLREMHNVPCAENLRYHKTIAAIRGQYFWPSMKKDVVDYMAKCMECQKVKVEHRHPIGLLQIFLIPEWKWVVVTLINFITKLPRTVKQHDSIMVVVDKLTKDAHFIPVNLNHKQDYIIEIYMREISRIHGVNKVFVFDRDSKFTSNLWKGLFKGFGTNLTVSTIYHP